MNHIEFLGTSGTRTPSQGTTCLQVSKHCVIDAGNLINTFGGDVFTIEHIFLTHSHLDHIIDIPFLADLFVTQKKVSLKIYALKETLEDLRQFIFNHRIWPNFEEINLIGHNEKTIELIEIFPDTPYPIDGITLTPFKTDHTEGSCGYLIEKGEHGILFTGDTYRCSRIWEMLEKNPHVHSLIIEVSFPSAFDKLAYDSKHLTPALLADELAKCKRSDFSVYYMHLKTLFAKSIVDELNTLNLLSNGGKVLSDGDRLDYASPVQTKKEHFSAISKIIAVGTALSAEKNIDALLEMIIVQLKQLTNADGGTLYLYHPQGRKLEFKIIQNDSLNIREGGVSAPIQWPPLNLYDGSDAPNRSMVAAVCALDKTIINIPDVYASKEYDFSGTIAFDRQTGYHSESMLVIPLADHEDHLIGVLQLINKKSFDGKVIPFTTADEELTLSLGSQAAVAMTKQKLINDLELLLESFLHTINVAIEEKSPYTAGHIDRMVDLSLALAQAISDDNEFFPHIHYTEDQLKEIKFSALMHDIGKITTPEHVIDKSTKLEAIVDRIEMIRLRYELLKRDVQTEFLLSSRTDNDHHLRAAALNELDQELAFLTNANLGSEYFSPSDIERVRHIAARTVTIGESDQPLLNTDEVFNLIVQKGTLTDEERRTVNNHAAVSLRMLKQLPFPQKLERVAEIAGGHHEKINGGGYPLGLKGDELSFEARILAIADIFEALSAADRPYKKGKKLSEAMNILVKMGQAGEIDLEIVRFFYESGLYLEYARKILPEESIDTVSLTFTP